MLVFHILWMQYKTMLMYMYTGMYINKNCIIYKCIHASLCVHVQVYIERINHDTKRKIYNLETERRGDKFFKLLLQIFLKNHFFKKTSRKDKMK